MKNHFLLFLVVFIFGLNSKAQNFSVDTYKNYRQSIAGITEGELANMFPGSSEKYLKGFESAIDFQAIDYLDSVILKLELTKQEIALLKQNMFFVTERLSYPNFGQAFHTVYNYDLPVFISTDGILHALHMSYDLILKKLERQIMAKNLEQFLKSLYTNFGELEQQYSNNKTLSIGVYDADVFITIAYSLISDKLLEPQYADLETVTKIWDGIQSEEMVQMQLFTYAERTRKFDFSQFKVRGHYVYTDQDKWMGLKSLEPYFKTMMWLGKIDFLLTPPPENPWETPWTDYEIQRMHYGAFMLNALLQKSEKLALLQFNEKIIDYLVGESDNIRPAEYQQILDSEEIISPVQLTDLEVFANFKKALSSPPGLEQKILSDFFLMDPQGDEPGVLPISWRVSGQRFIIDSYVLGNVVFDRLMHNGQKVMRMMPKPMDILFPLGNNDVLPLLKPEFEKYPYAEQLANLRYIIDKKPQELWSESLYNVWLNSIRKLNPATDKSRLPLFMKSAAWQHEKMNTQLASWSQLRHDNLLYAKQSYTGGTGCSFPMSYVEPYPEFYANIREFAESAGEFFSQLPTADPELTSVITFFPRFAEVMQKLEVLAEKQLSNSALSEDEAKWLKSMLFSEQGSGMPPYSGWYTDLFFDKWDAAEGDFTVVDVHTQPTDENGAPVGRVLHTGIGKVNLGVFLTGCPSTSNHLTAFVGPVMSYYEKITDNFYRITDQEWEQLVQQDDLPERPDWTRIYLAGKKGEMVASVLELPSKLYSGLNVMSNKRNDFVAYPNPVSNNLTLSRSGGKLTSGHIAIYNANGIVVKQAEINQYANGFNSVQISFNQLPEGLYILKITLEGGETSAIKIIKKGLFN